MEQYYLVLITSTERSVVNRACNLLEESGIPVMIEHVELLDGPTRARSYRVLVPSEFAQTGMRIVQTAQHGGQEQFRA